MIRYSLLLFTWTLFLFPLVNARIKTVTVGEKDLLNNDTKIAALTSVGLRASGHENGCSDQLYKFLNAMVGFYNKLNRKARDPKWAQ
jgi:hypothetical protein